MIDFEKRWKGVNGVESLGIFNPFGQHNVYRAFGNVFFAALETPPIITEEVHKKVAEEISRETDPLKLWAWQAAGNMTVPANMFVDIGLVAIDDSIHTTTSIGRYLGVIEDAANLPRRTVPSSSAPSSVDPASTRPKLRKATKEQAKSAAPKTPDGDYIDPNTGQVVPKEGPFDYGHPAGQEWWRLRDKARAEGWTREEVIEAENAKKFQIEDPSSNRGRKHELPR
jgi:hypothetical protein